MAKMMSGDRQSVIVRWWASGCSWGPKVTL